MSSGDEIDRQQGGVHDGGELDSQEEDSEVDELELARALDCTVKQLRRDEAMKKIAPASAQPSAEGTATARRLSLFEALAAMATRPGGLEDAQAMRDELRRKADSVAPSRKYLGTAGACDPNLYLGRRDRVTDEHLRTMTSMVYALSFAPLTVHTQIWCAWWWWPEEIAKLLEDIRFYGWGVGSLQLNGGHHDGSGNGAIGYLQRLKWVGTKREWHEGEDLTPEGREFFAKFLEMDLDDVPESLKQVPYVRELLTVSFVGLCAWLPISFVVCCCHKRLVLTRVHVILSS